LWKFAFSSSAMFTSLKQSTTCWVWLEKSLDKHWNANESPTFIQCEGLSNEENLLLKNERLNRIRKKSRPLGKSFSSKLFLELRWEVATFCSLSRKRRERRGWAATK
jgi:hypothetical protein